MKNLKVLLMAVLTFLSISVFAQDAKKVSVTDTTQKTEKLTYSCPMHPDVTSDKPGKCTKCGMALNLSVKEKMKYETMKLYTCPMHPEMKSDKPGKCTKCGMTLVEKKETHSKHMQ